MLYVQIWQTQDGYYVSRKSEFTCVPHIWFTEKDTLKTRWTKYLRRFNTLCKAIGITDDGQKNFGVINVYRGWNVWNLQKYHYCGGNYTCTSQCSFRDTLSTDFQSCLQMLPFPLIKTATRRNNSWILYTFEGASSDMWICGPHSRN